MVFKLSLWVAVVGGTDEQIQNAAVAGILAVLINVRIGVMPSNEAYKDYRECLALGFALVLKLHDMVHLYLTVSMQTALTPEQTAMWQSSIDQSDLFLVFLVLGTIVRFSCSCYT